VRALCNRSIPRGDEVNTAALLSHGPLPSAYLVPRSLHPRSPQIIAEALVSLAIFIPAIALAYPALQDVTYRGELAKR
jgi:uncharacterized membrane protein YhaH (DUF805 family)